MTLKKTTRHAFILFALLLTTTLCASAQRKNVQRIQFPTGRTTTVLKGVLRGDSDFTYILRASKGQTLLAHLVVNGDASLMAKGPNGRSLTNSDGSDAGNDFSIILQRTGDYRLIVFPPDTADRKDIARYTLEVTIR
ncbi:MAG: hypothetical protein QOH63_102 [Acidobacteriota bacterium]|jgi:hypothetical protein|nr:hypothetical protein [Acidobacteriota bacterium]